MDDEDWKRRYRAENTGYRVVGGNSGGYITQANYSKMGWRGIEIKRRGIFGWGPVTGCETWHSPHHQDHYCRYSLASDAERDLRDFIAYMNAGGPREVVRLQGAVSEPRTPPEPKPPGKIVLRVRKPELDDTPAATQGNL